MHSPADKTPVKDTTCWSFDIKVDRLVMFHVFSAGFGWTECANVDEMISAAIAHAGHPSSS